MKPSTPEFGDGPVFHGNPPDFSLVLGGPLFQLLRRAHLSDDALMMARQRVIVIALLAWLPLLVLSALEGRALGGGVAVPFLLDVEVQIRYLVALPLLIGAELIVHRRMRSILEIFQERRLIPEPAVPRFDAAVASAVRWQSRSDNSALRVRISLLAVAISWSSRSSALTPRPLRPETSTNGLPSLSVSAYPSARAVACERATISYEK